ncbi:MAG TPA: alpha/beta fold hydrolase [Microlunatus sp.]
MAQAIATDGTKISYQVEGTGETVLLLLAGQANNHRWWDRVRPDFNADFRTVTLDYRGTGDSDRPDTDSYSTRGFAADAIAVLDDIGARRVQIYGTSMGGRVAQWLAVDYADRVDRLVLGCTSPGGSHGIEHDQGIRRSLAVADSAKARRLLLELMYTPGWIAANPGPYFTLGDSSMPSYARRRHRIASSRHDAWDVLGSITAPTLIIHGTDDRFNPTANAPLLAERVPGARLELIKDARHAYFEEAREQATSVVLEFLAP